MGSIESQLRDSYADLYESGAETQSSIAKRLGVGRSVINRRLTGQNNMTIETLADMVWALKRAIRVIVFDPLIDRESNGFLEVQSRPSPVSPLDMTTPADGSLQSQLSQHIQSDVIVSAS